MGTSGDEPDIWEQCFADEAVQVLFESERHGLFTLWHPLSLAAAAQTDPVLRAGLKLLAGIASMEIRVDDWNDPFRPGLTLNDARSLMPGDLASDEIAMLETLAEHVPHALLQCRLYDVLAVRSSGKERVAYFIHHLDTLIAYGINDEAWIHEHTSWERALDTAKKFGKATEKHLASLEQFLTDAILSSTVTEVTRVRMAETLLKFRLGKNHADKIALALRNAAASSERVHTSHGSLEHSAEWFKMIGDSDAANESQVISIQKYIAEAEMEEASEKHSSGRAAYLYGLARAKLLTLPKTVRDSYRLGGLLEELAKRIRALGSESLRTMRRVEGDPIDFSELIDESRRRVRDLPPDRALLAFCALSEFASLDQELERAQVLVTNHPLSSIFPVTTFSSDGRVVHKTEGSGGAPIRGVDPAIWRQVMVTYRHKVQLTAIGALWPAYSQLIQEHMLSVSDFHLITRGSAVVPSERERQVARALYAGYTGDFSTAAQLLVPQIENIVRRELKEHGVLTSQLSPEGIESELGLGSLLERDAIDEIFGKDIAFELRALFVDPLGPNLRNEVAHGLLDDDTAESSTLLYAWWFGLRFVYVPFWNHNLKPEPSSPMH